MALPPASDLLNSPSQQKQERHEFPEAAASAEPSLGKALFGKGNVYVTVCILSLSFVSFSMKDT